MTTEFTSCYRCTVLYKVPTCHIREKVKMININPWFWSVCLGHSDGFLFLSDAFLMCLQTTDASTADTQHIVHHLHVKCLFTASYCRTIFSHFYADGTVCYLDETWGHFQLFQWFGISRQTTMFSGVFVPKPEQIINAATNTNLK